jgi:hypothetical protein
LLGVLLVLPATLQGLCKEAIARVSSSSISIISNPPRSVRLGLKVAQMSTETVPTAKRHGWIMASTCKATRKLHSNQTLCNIAALLTEQQILIVIDFGTRIVELYFSLGPYPLTSNLEGRPLRSRFRGRLRAVR